MHPVPGPIANPQSLAQRRDEEQRAVIRMAGAEIDDLKDGLRHAELMLAKSLHEKEQATAQLRDRGNTLEDLSAKLRQRDEESIRKDQMFRTLEQQLAQKDHAQTTIVDQTRDRLHLLQREITHREREVQDLRSKIKDREMQTDAALVSDKLNRHNVTKLKG